MIPENEITNDEHSMNLFKLNKQSAHDNDVKAIEKELQCYLARYHELLNDLYQTVKNYRDSAGKIDG